MTLPADIIEIFKNETEGLQFGKVSICFVTRGGHCHFEVEKHYTIMIEDGHKDDRRDGEGKGDG
jgi:hypothetical protein